MKKIIPEYKDIVINIFYIEIKNIYTCKCGDICNSSEKLLDIPLLFPKEKNDMDLNLNDLLSQYFNEEKIDWKSACQKCGRQNFERSKRIQLSILPKFIILSLQRFNPNTGVKINNYVVFKEIIDLKSFCDKDIFNGEIKTKYKPFGISNHNGTINEGHYFSYTKVGENWYEFNDSLVKPISLDLRSNTAYFFLYEKME